MKSVIHIKIPGFVRLPCCSSLILASCLISVFVSACGPQSIVNDKPLTKEERSLLETQPVHESRMASTARNGYTPTSVWQIQRPGDPHVMYIGGTSHLIKGSEFPLPSAYYAAYGLSDKLFVESTDSGMVMLIQSIFYLGPWIVRNYDEIICEDGKTIADYVKPKTLAALRKHYPDYDDIKRFKPAGVVMFGIVGQPGEEYGVESVFEAMAKRDKKPIGALDSRTKIVGTATRTMKMMMESTLEDIEKRGADAVIIDGINGDDDSFDNIRRGDVKSMDAELVDFEKEIGTELYNELLPERNERWAKMIGKLYQKKEKVFAIAGANHFAGPTGLPTLLRQQGFIVKQMYGVDRP